MLVFVVGVVVVMLPILLALVMGKVFVGLDSAVTQSKSAVENKDKGYNPNVTFGHRIKVQADPEAQMKEARLTAAKQAAATPRGANMRIGRAGQSDLKTASKGLNQDAQTAVKIAAYHGWDGAKSGIPAGGVPVAAPVAAVKTVAAPVAKKTLVAGSDYTLIPLTDNMSPEEKRKAIIANAKAKSAAHKTAKAAGETAGVVETVVTAAAPVVAPIAQPVAAAAALPEPEYINITDNMSPEEVRKARIENSKRKSAYQKALKAAGITLDAAPVAEAVAEVAAPVAAAAVVAETAVSALPEPEYIEITDSMSPDEVRRARIENSKRKSAYQKALKAANG